ncbi:helix-turn-helix transcriptional regulator [Metallibacterium sp.]|uniref:helix-turn-helix transcriptional regulator n=1 Tax=Metallibacterium sp. TaxID=2940281 RepID=UPI002624E242|nr:helix-turn-helix transcriptional regulator [Metallibacterium sp.]
MNRDPVSAKARCFELGSFLRSRRERLTPAEVGLTNGFRRRTPGLRREEVALLAGVGTTWYTWLEQGREVRASMEVLSALADALRLDVSERRHLFALSDRAAPDALPTGPEQVEASLQRMLDSLTGQPAYVTGRRWDVLAWNQAAVAVFGDYGALQGDERNLIHLVFGNARHRRLLTDWEELAPVSLAMFRADSARYAGDPDFDRLITALQQVSTEFRSWWPKHDVVARLSNIKRIQHPRKGRMVFEYTSFAVTDGSDRKLTLYTPLQEQKTVEKLEALLRKNGDATALTVDSMSKPCPNIRAEKIRQEEPTP